MQRNVIVTLVVILLVLIGATAALAQEPKGAPAWTFAHAKHHYHQSAEAAGLNYNRIPIAFREHALRSEMAYTACIATYAILYPDRSPKAVKGHCVKQDRKWLVWLNMELVESGSFPTEYVGQTAIAFLHVKRIHQVLRFTLRELTPSDARQRMVLKKYVVPMLVQQLRDARKNHELPTPMIGASPS